MTPTIEDLRANVELACQPSYVPLIEQGRSKVLAMPRPWVLESIEQVAVAVLDFSDFWEYHRLLELADMLDPRLLQRFVSLGLDHSDPEIREAAQDFHRGPSG